MRPHDFSKGRTVDGHDQEWTQTGLLEQIVHVLRATDWVQERFSSDLTAILLDRQSIRTPEGGGLVERTIAWFMKDRRLRVDYERLVAHSAAMIFLAMIHILISRLA